MFKKIMITILVVLLLVTPIAVVSAKPSNKTIGVNVLLNTDITEEILVDLGNYGRVRDTLYEIDALTLMVKESQLETIQALPYVEAANPDAVRDGVPLYPTQAEDFSDGLSTWNLDAINVTNFGFDNRVVDFDGEGVFVAVLDTGLVDTWRNYFPEERIAVEYARSFGGGGSASAAISEQPNKWEHDQNSHGTHVTSSIIGYALGATPINGAAPMVKIIPVKVLNQNGSGWSSVIAHGITYIANLKAEGGPLEDSPVVINMSLGGSILDAVEKAAIDYAIDMGVIIVASAGNRGEYGMGYPGAYEPVISVAASGWLGEWMVAGWWNALDVAEPTNPDHFYITDFSSRALEDQDLDVAAPGSWIVGPYKLNSGNTPTYYYLGGTSMASPHVAGVVALMADKYPDLTAFEAEEILEASAIPLPAGCLEVNSPGGLVEFCWGDDATGAGLLDAGAALDGTPSP